MTARETWVIELQDKFSKRMAGMESRSAKFQQTIMRVGGAIGIAFGGRQIINQIGKSINAYNQQEQAIAQVEQGLKSTGGTVNRTLNELTASASSLQSKTLFGDESILQGVTSQLLTFTNITGEQFDRTQQAALDVTTRLFGADASAESLRSTSIQLGKALNDPTANMGALSRSGIQFTKEQKDQIKILQKSGRLQEAQAIILTELEKQYGGSAEAAANAGTGGFKQFQNVLGDLSERQGKAFVDLFGQVPNVFKKMIEVPVSRNLKIQKTSFNRLAAEIKDTNLTTEERTQKIKQAQEIHPSFLRGITDEAEIMKVIDEQTTKANQALDARIKLQLQEERIALVREDIARQQKAVAQFQQKADEARTESEGQSLKTQNKFLNTTTKLLNFVDEFGIQTGLTKDQIGEWNQQVSHLNKEGLTESNKLLDEQQAILDGLKSDFDSIGDGKTVGLEVRGAKDVAKGVTKITSAAPKVFNINIDKLIETLNINSQTVQQGATDSSKIVLQALTTELNNLQIIAG